jgi:hypothetical protein
MDLHCGKPDATVETARGDRSLAPGKRLSGKSFASGAMIALVVRQNAPRGGKLQFPKVEFTLSAPAVFNSPPGPNWVQASEVFHVEHPPPGSNCQPPFPASQLFHVEQRLAQRTTHRQKSQIAFIFPHRL